MTRSGPGTTQDDLLTHLQAVVGFEHVLTDRAVVSGYARDWTGEWVGDPLAVVRPAATAEVAEVLRACHQRKVSVVVQGGNTGFVGGATPVNGELILSTRRLDRIAHLDPASGEIVVGAGVTVGDLHRHLAGTGWMYGVDLGSRDSATIGGTVATNAGGIHVVAYGDTRMQILGCEAVLSNGSVISRLDAPVKDNTGYSLTQLLVGSEGTLAVITAVQVRLHQAGDVSPTVTLVGLNAVDEALDLMRQQTEVMAAELMYDDGLQLVCSAQGLPFPLSRAWPIYLLLESRQTPLLPEEVDAAVDPRLWSYRELHTESIATTGRVRKFDVSVPLTRLSDFSTMLRHQLADRRVYVFGHLAEGNLHISVSNDSAGAPIPYDAVLSLVLEHGGSISSEHGIGRAKKAWMSSVRGGTELTLMRNMKRVFDPDFILNPEVLIPAIEEPR